MQQGPAAVRHMLGLVGGGELQELYYSYLEVSLFLSKERITFLHIIIAVGGSPVSVYASSFRDKKIS